MGPVAGFPAGRLVASHFSVMVKNTMTFTSAHVQELTCMKRFGEEK